MKELICIIIGHKYKFGYADLPDGKLITERCDRCGFGNPDGQMIPWKAMVEFEKIWEDNKQKSLTYDEVLRIFLKILKKRSKNNN